MLARQRTNHNSKQKRATRAKRGKTRVRQGTIGFGSLPIGLNNRVFALIGWARCMRFPLWTNYGALKTQC